jgi:hypothetical protein
MGLECERKMDKMDRKDQTDLAFGECWTVLVETSFWVGPFERFK